MTTPLSRERWKQLEPLLDAALEMEPSRRAVFVEESCADTTLRAELRRLVAACELGDTILSTPAVSAYAPLLVERVQKLPDVLGGRYRIVREIGRGGMATVYLADDPKHGRQVAVKALHSDVGRIIGRDRFVREIEIAARLSHPHILPLHDSGEVPSDETGEPSLLYFITPFAAGESLRDRLLREPRVPPEEVTRLGREIAQALDYAHRRGVIHLDIKPGNILLQDGHAIIADFGIARAMSTAGDDTPSRSMPLLGTPSYMSPEQASGAHDLDGRSDIYSLGCVLYEMITGERPFARLAARGVAPDPGLLRRDVPRELAAVIARAMAPARDDRYASAEEVAIALTAAAQPRKRRAWRRARILIGAGLCAMLPAAGFWMTRGTAAFDSDLIAVAPFDVAVPSLGLWKEGFVDVLSRSLDGAGALRAVPASVVVHKWHGRADASSAIALGRATGARLVLFGGLLAAGDSVRASVSLLDAQTGRTVAEFDERDEAVRIDRLSDALTLAVLRQLGRSRRIDMANAIESPTASVAALKAYLQGEQYYRAALWDSAQMHFERALALDTTFALAYHRLAAVLRVQDQKTVPDSDAYVLMRKPSLFPRGLGPRERLLATIDSMSAVAYFAWRQALQDGRYVNQEELAAQLCALLADASKRYPNDAEIAYLHAEARSRYEGDVLVGEVDDRAGLSRFDRAIALDSTFAPAYVPPIALAAYLDGEESARRYIQAYLAMSPTGPRAQLIKLDDDLLDPVRASAVDVSRLVETQPAEHLCEAAKLLRHIPDSAETVVRMARALEQRATSRTSPPRDDQMCILTQTIDGLQFRGHLRDAMRLSSRDAHWLRPAVMYNMVRAGMLPADTLRTESHRLLGIVHKAQLTKLYRWWADDGDTIAIKAYLDHFNLHVGKMGTLSSEALIRSSITAGEAHLALARRDTASALRQLLTTSDSLHECWYDDRMTITQTLIAVGRYAEAAQRLQRRWPGTTACSNGFDDVVWTMERARVFDRLGLRAAAVENYAFVAEAWRNADEELQPIVRESRAALARLRQHPS